MSISKGTIVAFSVRDGSTKTGTFSHYTKSGLCYIKVPGGFYERKPEKVTVVGEATTSFESSSDLAAPAAPILAFKSLKTPPKTFGVNEKFDFLAAAIRMVIKKQRCSLLVTGEGGLGKTHTVREEMAKKGLEENIDYVFIKGYSTAKGLYNTLYDHQDKIIIFDDTDEVLKNDIAKNILKGALDSYDERIVNWISKSFDDDYPNSFEFRGQIIFISNLSQEKIDQAIRSRATTIDITMSIADKFDRMEFILPRLKGGVSMEAKLEAFNLLKENQEYTNNINLRTLQEIIDIRTSGEENWKEIAEFIMYSTK